MNGYTQLNLDKVRGFKWGKYAFEKYMRMLNYKPDDSVSLSGKLNSEHSAIILYCGLSMNCFVKQEDPDFTFEQCVEWDEQMKPEDQAKINEAVQSNTWFSNFSTDIKKKVEELENLPLENGGRKKRKR